MIQTIGKFRTLLAAALLAGSACAASAQALAQFNLPAQPLADSLRALASQTNINVLFDPPLVASMRAPALNARLSPDEALARLLAGTGLKHRFVNEHTVVLGSGKQTEPPASKGASMNHALTTELAGLKLAQSESAAPAPADSVKAVSDATAEKSAAAAGNSEVVVTGSRIRKTDTYGPSPVSSYSIEDIRATGAMTVSDFLSKLPQTYGGVSAGRSGTPNELNLEYGQRNEKLIPASPPLGGSPLMIPLAQTGVSGVSLRSLGAGSTLVLVDGRRVAQSGNGNRASATGQGFVDLNTIPLGLIERIDVITDGASAIYGADAVAGVVNIILKKDWLGTELASTMKFTQDGGAGERQISLTSGFGKAGVRGTVAFDYYQRDPMVAAQRDFTRNMDHRNRVKGYDVDGNPLYGTDHRIQFGTVSTVQAIGGAVPGTFDALPGIRVVLTPEGSIATPAIADFIPRTTIPEGQFTGAVNAQGQRHFDPSGYLQLVPESERYGVTGNGTYTLASNVEIYGTASYTRTRGFASSLPPYNSTVVTQSRVPAAYNPFGQDVMIAMVHLGFGVENQRTQTDAYSMTAGMRGSMGQTWRWDAGTRWQRQDFSSRNRRFNGVGLPALMSNPDPAQRFNPFIDYSAPGAPDVSALYGQLAIHNSVDAVSEMATLDLSADGELFPVWGGPVRAAIGGSFERPEVSNTVVNVAPAVVPNPTTTSYSEVRKNAAAFGELSVPLFGQRNARPLLRRLELQLAGRIDEPSDAPRSVVPKLGFSWSPVQSLLVRASYSEGFRAPSLTEDQGINGATSVNYADPARGGVVTNFTVRTGPNSSLVPETSTNEFYGLVWEPPFAKGLNLQVNYYRTIQKDAIQQVGFGAILTNEAMFPGRVTRAAPTADDIALGIPGAVLEVVQYTANFGEIRNESIDFLAEYRLPWERWGNWRISTNASHTLESSRALTPGGPPIDDVGDTYAGPKWKGIASLYWSKSAWTASMTAAYLSGFTSNNAGYQFTTWSASTPSVRKFDARAGYVFEHGLWRGLGKELRLDLSVENLTDEEPPFMDVMYGFNMALHSEYVRGRTWGLSMVLPF